MLEKKMVQMIERVALTANNPLLLNVKVSVERRTLVQTQSIV